MPPSSSTTTSDAPVPPRTRLVIGAVIGALALSAVLLGMHAAGEGSRTAESVCRSALLAITPSTTFVGELRVRNLSSIETAAEPQVAEVVDNYAPSSKDPSASGSAYVVQGDVRFGHADATALTCLVVLEGGKSLAAPLFATASE